MKTVIGWISILFAALVTSTATAQSIIGQAWDGTTSVLPLNLDPGQVVWDNFTIPSTYGPTVSVNQFAAFVFYNPSLPFTSLRIQIVHDSGGMPYPNGGSLLDVTIPTSAMSISNYPIGVQYGGQLRSISWQLPQNALVLPTGEQLWIRYLAPSGIGSSWLGSMLSDQGDGTCFRYYGTGANEWMPYNMVFQLSIVPEPSATSLILIASAIVGIRGLIRRVSSDELSKHKLTIPMLT